MGGANRQFIPGRKKKCRANSKSVYFDMQNIIKISGTIIGMRHHTNLGQGYPQLVTVFFERHSGSAVLQMQNALQLLERQLGSMDGTLESHKVREVPKCKGADLAELREIRVKICTQFLHTPRKKIPSK